jgi:hypothetical protein
MSSREVLIILAHAQMCAPCRERLLEDPNAVCRGRAITNEEKELLGTLTAPNFATAESLAAASGCDECQLVQNYDHPVARLRHF